MGGCLSIASHVIEEDKRVIQLGSSATENVCSLSSVDQKHASLPKPSVFIQWPASTLPPGEHSSIYASSSSYHSQEHKTIGLSPPETAIQHSAEMTDQVEKDSLIEIRENTAMSPHSSKQSNRAFRHRIENARRKQHLLSQSPQSSSYRSIVSESNSNESYQYASDLSDQILLPQQYTHSEHTNMKTNQMRIEEFKATKSQGATWAQIERDDIITCLAISRTDPTLGWPTPKIFLTEGTASGTVMVTELLDSSQQLNPVAASDQAHSLHEIGSTHCISRSARIRSLDFSPDGRFLAVGGDDSFCTVIRLKYNSNGGDLKGLETWEEFERVDRVYAVQFSPDSEYLAIGGFDGNVTIVRVANLGQGGKPTTEADIPSEGLVYVIDWSPDGQFVAFGGTGKSCCIVDAHDAAWQVVHEIRLQATIHTLKWSPTKASTLAVGSTIVSIVESESFQVLHEISLAQKSGRKQRTQTHPATSCKIHALCWSPSGSYLVIASSKVCTLVETKTFESVHEIARPANITSVVWGQQNAIGGTPRRYLAIASEDKQIMVIKAGIEPGVRSSSVGGDERSASSNSLQSNRSDWVLQENQFLDVDTASLPREKQPPTHKKVNVVTVAFSRGSKARTSVFFAYSLDDGTVVVRSTTDWKIITERHFASSVRALSFSNGSRYLAFGCDDSIVYVSQTFGNWELISKTTLACPIRSLGFSKNNERLAAATVYGRLTLLECDNNYRSLGEVKDSASTVLALDWSSKYLAAGRKDGTVGIYSCPQVFGGRYLAIASLRCVGAVYAISFGAGSRFLAVGGEHGVGIYSEKDEWVPCHHLRFKETISTLRWNATGQYLALGGAQGLFKVVETIFWTDVEAVSSLFPATSCAAKAMPSVAFGQDGTMVAYSDLRSGVTVASCSEWMITFRVNDERSTYGSVDVICTPNCRTIRVREGAKPSSVT